MAQTAEEKFNEIIEEIKDTYKITVDKIDGVTFDETRHDKMILCSIILNNEDEVVLNLVFYTDGKLDVELLEETCTTQEPFNIVKSILETNWEPCTYIRNVSWYYSEDDEEEYGGDGDIMRDAVDGFDESKVKPRHFEDDYCSLDVETCTDVDSYDTGSQSFDYSVSFCCSASKEQLNNINELFDEYVVDHIQGFFDDDGIDGDIDTDDSFYKE